MRTPGVLRRLGSPRGVLLLVALLACIAGTVLLINLALTMLGNGLAQQRATETPRVTSTATATPAAPPE